MNEQPPPVVQPAPTVEAEAVPIWVEQLLRSVERGIPWPFLELDEAGQTWFLDSGPEEQPDARK